VPAAPAVAQAAKPAPSEASAAVPAVPKPPAPDPRIKWNDDLAKLRAKVQELEDRERTLQLQVNQLTNQFFAPVSDQNSKDLAQARLGETQNSLMAVRTELEQTRKTLADMQIQGPPKQ
jgi:hypothetical protein